MAESRGTTFAVPAAGSDDGEKRRRVDRRPHGRPASASCARPTLGRSHRAMACARTVVADVVKAERPRRPRSRRSRRSACAPCCSGRQRGHEPRRQVSTGASRHRHEVMPKCCVPRLRPPSPAACKRGAASLAPKVPADGRPRPRSGRPPEPIIRAGDTGLWARPRIRGLGLPDARVIVCPSRRAGRRQPAWSRPVHRADDQAEPSRGPTARTSPPARAITGPRR
jgi:hypothetical protein